MNVLFQIVPASHTAAIHIHNLATEWELLRVISFAQGQVTRLHIYDYRPRFDS